MSAAAEAGQGCGAGETDPTFAVDTTGQGAPLILIGSASNDRATMAGLAIMVASQAQDLRWSQSVATP
ncbi:hypothetical protein [Streptomyces sp. NPDC005148]